MSEHLLQGLLLGLAMGTTCLATCGPIYGPFLLQRARGIGGSLHALMQIFAGRFVAYAAFGAIAGFIGAGTAIFRRPFFSVAAFTLSAVFLIVSAFVSFRTERSCSAARWTRFADRPFFLGAITGINFCPSFLVALAKSVTLGGVWSGLLFFVFFFLGTSIYMLPLVALYVMADKRVFRLIGRIASVGVAVWLLYSAALILLASKAHPAS